MQNLIGWDISSTGLYDKKFKLDTATGRFKVPKDGKYQVNATAAFELLSNGMSTVAPTSAAEAPYIAIRVYRKGNSAVLVQGTGSWVQLAGDSVDGVIGTAASGVFKLKKGDQLELVASVTQSTLGSAGTATLTATDGHANTFSAQRLV